MDEDFHYRVYLNVPYGERDAAKRSGARWSPGRKAWYVPADTDHLDLRPFQRWLSEDDPDHNVRADGFWIARNRTDCWCCGESSPVYGFLLPPGSEQTRHVIDDEQMGYCVPLWEQVPIPFFVHYVSALPAGAFEALTRTTASVYIDHSKTARSDYWMNHCERCGTKFGDFQLFCEPDGAFGMMSDDQAGATRLHWVDHPFAADAATSLSTGAEDLFALMVR